MPASEIIAEGMPSVAATTIDGDRVRQQMPEHDPPPRRPETARRLDELFLLERHRIGPDNAGDRQPTDQSKTEEHAD